MGSNMAIKSPVTYDDEKDIQKIYVCLLGLLIKYHLCDDVLNDYEKARKLQ